jgi:hypothetical protein
MQTVTLVLRHIRVHHFSLSYTGGTLHHHSYEVITNLTATSFYAITCCTLQIANVEDTLHSQHAHMAQLLEVQLAGQDK